MVIGGTAAQPTYTFTASTSPNLVGPGGQVTMKIVADGQTFNPIFSWSISYAGAKGNAGTDGTNAITIGLTSTAQTMIMPAGGGVPTTPANVTVTGTTVGTAITNWDYSIDGGATWAAGLPAGVTKPTGSTVAINGQTMAVNTIVVRAGNAPNGAGLYDTYTVARISNGAQGGAGVDAYTVLLSNEAAVFAGTATTAAAKTAAATTTVSVYKGATKITADLRQPGAVTGMVFTRSATPGLSPALQVDVTTALLGPTGQVPLVIDADGQTFNATFSWAISFVAPTVSLTSTTQALISAPTGTGPTTPTTAIVTGTAVGTTIATWDYMINNAGGWVAAPAGVSAPTGTPPAVTITGGSLPAGTNTLAVRATTATGVSDTMTVAKVLNGSVATSTSTTYQVHTNGTTAPTGTWLANPPAVAPGQFLWSRTVTNYSDGTTNVLTPAYSVGAPGLGISSTATTYQLHTAGVVPAPTGTWVANPPATSPGNFLWTRTVTTYTDGSTNILTPAYSISAHGATGNAGADAYTVFLSNENQTFAAGLTNALATSSTTTITALKGTVAQNITVGSITGGVTGISAAVTSGQGGTAPVITFTVLTTLTTPSGAFTIPFVADSKNFSLTYSWSLSFKGASGIDAATIDLAASTQTLLGPAGGGAGATVPTTSTVTGTAVGTTISTWDYSTDGGVTFSTAPTGVVLVGNVVTITGGTMAVRSVVVRARNAGGTVLDQLTVSKAYDGAAGGAGADAYTVLLSNETAVFPGTTNAVVPGATASGTVTVYKGATPITCTVTPSGTTGLTASGPATGTTPAYLFTTAAGLATTGQVNVKVDADGKTFNSTFSWAISFTGLTGTAAPTVTLTSTTQTLVSPAAGGATTPTQATITGAAGGTTLSVWEASVNGAAYVALSTPPTGVVFTQATNTVVITGANLAAATSTVAIRMGNGTISDTFTVARVYTGADAYTVLLSNEAAVFPGTTTAVIAGNTANGTVTVYKGATPITCTVTPAGTTGLTASGPATGTNPAYTYTTAAGLALSGQVNVKIDADGKTFNSAFSWSVGLQGSQGNTGNTGSSVIATTPYYATTVTGAGAPAKPTNQAIPPGPWNTVEPAYAPDTVLYRTDQTTYANPTSYSYSAVVTVSSFTAASTAYAAANGKNTVYYSATKPTTPAAGVPAFVAGDTWFDTAHGYAMSVHDGSDFVLSLLDQGSIAYGAVTANEISSSYAYLGEVLADRIKAGNVVTPLVLTGKISTPVVGGGYTELNSEGIKIYGAAGNTTLTPAFTEFKGQAEVTNLTVKGLVDPVTQLNTGGGITIRNTGNELSRNSKFTLSNGVSAPSSPPGYTIDNLAIPLTGLDFTGYTAIDMTWNAASSRWWVTLVYTSPTNAVSAGIYAFRADGSYEAIAGGTTFAGGAASFLAGVRDATSCWYLVKLSSDNIWLYNKTDAGIITSIIFRPLSTSSVFSMAMDGTQAVIAEQWVSSGVQHIQLTRFIMGATAGPNLVVNGDFETNITGWTKAGPGALTWTNVSPVTGVGSMQMQGTAGGNTVVTGPLFAVTPRKVYTFTTKVRADVAVPTFDVSILWYTAGGVYIDYQGASSNLRAATVETLTNTLAAAPNNATQAAIRLTCSSGAVKYVFDTIQCFSNAGMNFVSVDELIMSGASTVPANALYIGSGDFGAKNYVVGSTGLARVVPDTSKTEDTTKGFAMPSQTPSGIGYDGTNFWTLSTDRILYKHEGGNVLGAQTQTWAAASTYRDATPHETAMSDPVTITMKNRARLTLTTAPLVTTGSNDPTQIVLYLNKAGTTTRTDYHTQGVSTLGVPGTGVALPPITAASFVTASPLDPTIPANQFPASSPAELASGESVASPLISFKGDGSGRIGQASWDANGVWTGAAVTARTLTQPTAPSAPADGDLWYDDDDTPPNGDTGWVTGWVNATGNTAGWTLANITEARYRLLNGMVEVRMATSLSATYGPFVNGNYTNNQIAGGLPAGFCPDTNIVGTTHLRETNVVTVIRPDGMFIIVGGSPNLTFASGDLFYGSWLYMRG